MPRRCICFGCNNISDPKRGIGLHQIPFVGDERPEAKRRRAKWIKFVATRRKNWKPSCNSKASICSAHFRPEDFASRFNYLYNSEDSCILTRLVGDDVGVAAYPTIHSMEDGQKVDNIVNIHRPTPSPRERRIIMREIMNDPLYASILHPEKIETESAPEQYQNNDSKNEKHTTEGTSTMQANATVEAETEGAESQKWEKSTQTTDCRECIQLKSVNRQQKNRIIGLRYKLKEKNTIIKKLKNQLAKSEQQRLGVKKVNFKPVVKRTKGQLALIKADHNYTANVQTNT